MFRHLLVPLDGSPLAESALPAAVRIAALFDARLTVLHIVEVDPPATVHGARHLTDPSEAEAYLAEVVSWLTSKGIRASSHVHVPGMEAARGIAEHARELEADLVVLCAHGGRGVRGLLHGRLGQKVVAEGEAPVLVVPAGPAGRETDWECRRILAALSRDAGEQTVLEPAVELARAAGAELALVRVVATPETVADERRWPARLLPGGARALLDAETKSAVRSLERLGGELEAGGLRVQGMVERGETVAGIAVATERCDADLVVLATRGLVGLSAVWGGSVAARLIERIDRSLLLTRRPPAEP